MHTAMPIPSLLSSHHDSGFYLPDHNSNIYHELMLDKNHNNSKYTLNNYKLHISTSTPKMNIFTSLVALSAAICLPSGTLTLIHNIWLFLLCLLYPCLLLWAPSPIKAIPAVHPPPQVHIHYSIYY